MYKFSWKVDPYVRGSVTYFADCTAGARSGRASAGCFPRVLLLDCMSLCAGAPTYYVCQLTREHELSVVRVVGDSGR